MNEEKRNRIIGAVTVNAVLLIVIIIAVVVYQIVMISVLSSQKKDLLEDVARLQQEYQEAEDDLTRLQIDGEYRDLRIRLNELEEGLGDAQDDLTTTGGN